MKSWCLSTPPSKQLWTSMMEFFLSGKTATAASSERTLLIFSSWWRRRKSGPWNGSGKNFVCQTFLSLKEEREREMSTCNMGGFGGKLCHKCPLSNYDNLTLAKWWLMDEENRWRDKTRRRLLFLLLLKSSLLSSQGNCILKMMCIYFREIDVNFAAPIFETFLKWINGALHITFLLNVKFNKSIAALQKSEVGMHFISLIKLHVQ